MLTTLQQEIENVLKEFPNYWDNDVLLKNVLIEDIRNYKPEILSALLKIQPLKKTYSLDINGLHIFKLEDFISMLRYKNYLENSYTKYNNEIGLTVEGKYLKYSSDVVLDFPHKDCLIEGGMTKEDSGKEEIYYHNVLAKEEIDTLLSPKVLRNIKRYDKDGSKEIDNFTNKDNLILKGNNLIALYTLKNQYAGKVKMIYIDPPYNTGSDSFTYNDKFNHSAWLTFMKNRLEIARELLTDDGYIFVQTDSEQAYLKVLMDSIFGRNQYVNTISVLFKNIAGASGGGEDKRLKKNIEYITIYSKNRDLSQSFNSVYEFKKISDLVQVMREEGVSWKYTSILVDSGTEKYVGSTIDGAGYEIKLYKQENPVIKSISSLMKEENLTEEQAYDKYGKFAFQTAMPQSSIRPRVMKKWQELDLGENDLMSIRYVPRTGKNKGIEYKQFYKGNAFRLFAWLKDVSEEIDGTLYKRDNLGTFWNFVGETKNVNKEGQVEFPNGKKPERLIGKIIEMATEPNDLVLDFFGGSGTTAAVALKLGRKFISLEQMEYQVSLQIKRLKNVINGSDQNGLSSDVDWQGGGSFVYAELFELNQVYINEIQEAVNPEEIEAIIHKIKNSPFLNIKVDIEKLLNKKEAFFDLSLQEQKLLLIQVLDNNQLYLNYSEIDDDQYAIDDQTKAFNRSFYQEEV